MAKKISLVITTHNRKDAVARLIDSIKASSVKPADYEIIVVDDFSSDGTKGFLSARFPEIAVIRNEEEKLVAESRNIGIRASKGDYIFMIDDDNVLDKKCIENLYLCMAQDPSIGMAMPAIHSFRYPEHRACIGVRRNMITTFTTLVSNTYEDGPLIETLDCPNAFMCRKDALLKTGLFNSKDYPMHYEEADIGIRIKRAGFRIVCNLDAKTFHGYVDRNNALAEKSVHTPMRAYYTSRNRIVFHSTYSKPWEFILFTLVFYPVVIVFYSYLIIRYSKSWNERVSLLRSYLKGNADGWGFAISRLLLPKKAPRQESVAEP